MAIVLALSSAFVFGAADFLGGMSAKRSPAIAVAAFSQLVGGLVLLAIIPLLGATSVTTADVAWGASGGLFGAIALVAFYGALASGRMNVVAPTTAVVSAAIPVVAGLGLGERPTLIALGGVGLALPAVALVSAGEHGAVDGTPRSPHRFAHPVVAAVLAGVGFGMFFVVMDRTGDDAGMWPLVAARSAGVPLLVLIGASRRRLTVTAGTWRLIVAAGVLDMTANALYLLAVRRGLLALIGVLSALYPVSTMVLARLTLGEHFHRTQIVGLGAAGVAVTMVAFG